MTRPNQVLAWMTAAAIPAALLLETAIQPFLPADFQDLREAMGPYSTWLAWGMVPMCAIGGAVGHALHGRILAKRVRRLPEERRTQQRLQRENTGVFLLTSSIPQVPGIVTSVCWLLGCQLWPVLATVVVVTASVLTLARRSSTA